jgi:hypothetical protein
LAGRDFPKPLAHERFSAGLEARLYGRQDARRYEGSAKMLTAL